MQRFIAEIRRGIIAQLRARIERDVASGRLPAGTDADALAAMVVTVIQGMSVLARDGVSRARLIAIGKSALLGWPSPPGHAP